MCFLSLVGKSLPVQSFRHLQVCQAETHKTVQADGEMSQLCDYLSKTATNNNTNMPIMWHPKQGEIVPKVINEESGLT